MRGQSLEVRRRGILDQYAQLAPRRDIHLSADLANAENEALDPADLGLRFCIGRKILRLREGLQHDRVAANAGEGGQLLPDFFRHEGHHRMQASQQLLEHGDQGLSSACLLRFGATTLQYRLGELQVPVAILVPGEFVEVLCCEIEAIRFEVITEGGDRLAKA